MCHSVLSLRAGLKVLPRQRGEIELTESFNGLRYRAELRPCFFEGNHCAVWGEDLVWRRIYLRLVWLVCFMQSKQKKKLVALEWRAK